MASLAAVLSLTMLASGASASENNLGTVSTKNQTVTPAAAFDDDQPIYYLEVKVGWTHQFPTKVGQKWYANEWCCGDDGAVEVSEDGFARAVHKGVQTIYPLYPDHRLEESYAITVVD